MGIINNLKFNEFKKALHSIDHIKIVDMLEGWGKKYFDDKAKEYLDELRRFLAQIVYEMGERIKK